MPYTKILCTTRLFLVLNVVGEVHVAWSRQHAKQLGMEPPQPLQSARYIQHSCIVDGMWPHTKPSSNDDYLRISLIVDIVYVVVNAMNDIPCIAQKSIAIASMLSSYIASLSRPIN